MNLSELVKKQKLFFRTGRTLKYDFRMNMLMRLKSMILDNEEDIANALRLDLHKSYYESYETEIGTILEEIGYFKKRLRYLMKGKYVGTPLHQFLSRSKVYPNPYGVVLNICPWNYPCQLAMDPLIGSIAAGNCTIIKLSQQSYNTSKLLSKLINNSFNENYISCIIGGEKEVKTLISQAPDYILFTGSSETGKKIMQQASQNLIPVTLELGGKSPCIVDETANLKVAAKRIVWGKFLNAGQTCIAPDYLLVQEKVFGQLVVNIKKEIVNTYGNNPVFSNDYPYIINETQFNNLKKKLLVANCLKEHIDVLGNLYGNNNFSLAPILIEDTNFASTFMQDEIFGPVLPIIKFESIDKIICKLQTLPNPLAMYVFTKNKNNAKKLFSKINVGGGCINDTISHFANNRLPFGGVGNSGMGNYHGERSFETLSHYQSILMKSNFFDIPFKYLQHKNIKLLKLFLH